MDTHDIETKLDRIEAAESPLRKYGIQLITLVFLAGGGWVTLDSVKALADENKQAIVEEKKKTDEIDDRLIRIEVKQQAIKEQLEKSAQTANENAKKLDKILNKLEDD